MSSEWVPFGLDGEELVEYEVLLDGVPDWLREPLVSWVLLHVQSHSSSWCLTPQCLDVQLNTRVSLGAKSGSSLTDPGVVLTSLRRMSGLELLRVADYFVSRTGGVSTERARRLESVLRAAKSKWTVGNRRSKPGLVERVPEGVQTSVEGVIETAGSAGKILARSWAHVHGLQPNDSAGYADAVRAVEIVAIDVVQPGNQNATLGTVINQMRTQSDWGLPLREHEHAPSPELLLTSTRTLWHGHRDRHGSADYSDVTHDEARAAVTLAATLVDWFSSGAVRRRPASVSRQTFNTPPNSDAQQP